MKTTTKMLSTLTQIGMTKYILVVHIFFWQRLGLELKKKKPWVHQCSFQQLA